MTLPFNSYVQRGGFTAFVPNNEIDLDEVYLPRKIDDDPETGRSEKLMFSELKVCTLVHLCFVYNAHCS